MIVHNLSIFCNDNEKKKGEQTRGRDPNRHSRYNPGYV